MDQETLNLLISLHVNNPRQGPGSEATFSRALELAAIDTKAPLQIADIGSGTGAASIALAHATNASITAVDLLPPFLEKLKQRAESAGVMDRITTIEADMSELPLNTGQFDVIWSEGAIYNIGFRRGIAEWKKFLKPGGVLVVTEITWLTPDIPEELYTYWNTHYPEIALASTKLQQLENTGYTPVGYFVLTPDCWLDEYYTPLESSFTAFLDQHKHSDQAKAIVEADKQEIAFYKKYKAYYSYGCYIARKLA